ncbi:MAG TPA: YihY/virulence factor BrkB family protein, partial [Anaeromyxobacteraceae bacterium]|nr:YihY/virulence factor BrkB family protein [Anaeromyxobacteraceae bacterium]
MATRVASPMGPAAPHDERSALERLRAFFVHRIWAVRLDRLDPGRALLYGASRVGYAAVHGFVRNRVTVRAAALTYYTVLSLVPFLAFSFAILKGFGAYDSFIEGTVRPYIDRTFGANTALLGSIERILQFVERTNVSALGAVGLVALVYTSVSLLGSVEDALNEIWGARTRRSFLRQVTDYVTLLVTTPLLVVAATAAATAAQSSGVVVYLRDALDLGEVIDLVLRFTSLATVGVAFFAVYVILPNVRIRPLSALLGAGVAAVLWQLVLVLYVRLQVGVSSYNALYSVLGALPIFLVWTYASWLVLLVGGQVAAGHQNQRLLRQRLRSSHLDQALRETLAVLVVTHVTRDFLEGAPRRRAAALAEAVGAPELAVQDVLDALARGRVLVRTEEGGQARWVPGGDVDALRVSDVRDAVRRDGEADDLRADVERHVGRELAAVLAALEAGGRAAPQNVTLRRLAALLSEPAP